MNYYNAPNCDGLNSQEGTGDQQNWNLYNFPPSSSSNNTSFVPNISQSGETQNFPSQSFFNQKRTANRICENQSSDSSGGAVPKRNVCGNRNSTNCTSSSNIGYNLSNRTSEERYLNNLEKTRLLSHMMGNERYPASGEMPQSNTDACRYNLRPRRISDDAHQQEYSSIFQNYTMHGPNSVQAHNNVSEQKYNNSLNSVPSPNYYLQIELPASYFSCQNNTQTSEYVPNIGRNQENVWGNTKNYNFERERYVPSINLEPPLIDLTKEEEGALNLSLKSASFRPKEINMNKRQCTSKRTHTSEEVDAGQTLLQLNVSGGSSPLLPSVQHNEETASTVNYSALYSSANPSNRMPQSVQNDALLYNNFLKGRDGQDRVSLYNQFTTSTNPPLYSSRSGYIPYHQTNKPGSSNQNQQNNVALHRMQTRSQLHNYLSITTTVDPERQVPLSSFTSQRYAPESQISGDLNKRSRATYTPQQVEILEEAFQRNKYVSREVRGTLSRKIGVSEKQVKVWYQNRRMRDKKKDPTVRVRGRRNKRSPERKIPEENFTDKLPSNFTSCAKQKQIGITSPGQAFEYPNTQIPTFSTAQLMHPSYRPFPLNHNPVSSASQANFQNPFRADSSFLAPSFPTSISITPFMQSSYQTTPSSIASSFSVAQFIPSYQPSLSSYPATSSSFLTPVSVYPPNNLNFATNFSVHAEPPNIEENLSPSDLSTSKVQPVDDSEINFDVFDDSGRSTPSLAIEFHNDRTSSSAKSELDYGKVEITQNSESANQKAKDSSSNTGSPPTLLREDHRLSANIAEAILLDSNPCMISPYTESSERLDEIPDLLPVLSVNVLSSGVGSNHCTSSETELFSINLPANSSSCIDTNYSNKSLVSLEKMIEKFSPENRPKSEDIESLKDNEKNIHDQNFQSSCNQSSNYMPADCNLATTDRCKSESIPSMLEEDFKWETMDNTSSDQTVNNQAQPTNMSYTNTQDSTIIGNSEAYISESKPSVASIDISKNPFEESAMQNRTQRDKTENNSSVPPSTVSNTELSSHMPVSALQSNSSIQNPCYFNSGIKIKEEPLDENEFSTAIKSDSFLFDYGIPNINASTSQANSLMITNRISSAFSNPHPIVPASDYSRACMTQFLGPIRPTFNQGYNHMFTGQGGNLYSYENASYEENNNSLNSPPQFTTL